jgi:hypothetical protein
MKQYIKLLKQDLLHREYQWKFGLNSIEVFNTEKECTSDALYICEIKDFFTWMSLLTDIVYVGYVTIPEDAKTFIMEDKIKTNKVILHEPLISLVDFIDIAVKYQSDINAGSSGQVFKLASINGNLDVIKSFIKHGMDVNKGTIYNAAHGGHLDVVELLIKHGADIHVGLPEKVGDEDYALRLASSNGHLSVVELLLKHGANVHANNDYALQWASYYGHLAVVELLIKHGADVRAENDAALLFATQKKHFAVIKCLISHGAVRAKPNCHRVTL